jgi:hypothetical protein
MACEQQEQRRNPIRKRINPGILTILALVLVTGALVVLSGCAPPKPAANQVVETINCPSCGGSVVLMSDKGAEGKEHVCLYCKEVWDRVDAYSGTGWVTVCQKCDKVVGACPACMEKMKAAKPAA